MEHIAPCPDLRLVMLLHDCAKPRRFTVDFRGDGHFYGHAAESARLARLALERLRCPQALTERVVRLIHYHDHDILPTRKSLLRWLGRLSEQDLRDLLQVKIADNLAQHPRYLRVDRFQQTLALLEDLLAERPCFDRSGLALRGSDLVALGCTGPAVGQSLDRRVAAVIDGQVDNERSALLRFLQT